MTEAQIIALIYVSGSILFSLGLIKVAKILAEAIKSMRFKVSTDVVATKVVGDFRESEVKATQKVAEVNTEVGGMGTSALTIEDCDEAVVSNSMFNSK